MKKFMCICVAILTLVAIGCDPEQGVVWAPDGQKAAVIGPDGFYLCDPSGKLSGLLIKDVRKVAWFGDSRHIVTAREVKVSTWKEATKYLEAERIKKLEAEGEKLFKEMMEQQGPLDRWAEELLHSPSGPDVGDFVAMVLYVGERHGEELKKKLTEDEWKKLQDGDGTAVTVVQMYEMAGNEAREGLILGSTFSQVAELRPSPNGKALAYVTGDGGDKGLFYIFAVPTDGTAQPRRVADLCARFVDWSMDGRYVAYARANPPKAKVDDTLRLGTLRRMQVCEGDGTLRTQPFADEVRQEKQADGTVNNIPSPAESLAGIIFNEWTKVRCLRDGRIIFVSCEVNLPVTSDDMPTRLSLFAVDPGKQATVSRLLSRRVEGEVGDALQHFEINPDQTAVAIPGSDGRMTVVSLNGANVTEVVGKSQDKKLHMVPSWRSSDELCFAIGNEKEKANQRPAEVYLWRHGEAARPISKEWPDEVVAVMKRN